MLWIWEYPIMHSKISRCKIINTFKSIPRIRDKLTAMMPKQIQNYNKLMKLRENRICNTAGTLPAILQIEPNLTCNAKCPLCPMGNGSIKRPENQISLELFQDVILQVQEFTYAIELWRFGEPFLHSNIYEMISYATSHGLYVRTSTNGYPFYKRENIKKMIDSRLSEIIVGIEGDNQDTHELYRKGTNLAKIIDGLELLKEEKKRAGVLLPKVTIQMIALRQNEAEINQVSSLAQILGGTFRLKSVNVNCVDIPAKQKLQYLPIGENIPNRYKLDTHGEIILKERLNNYCPKLWETMVINADGQVSPCFYDQNGEVVLGDAKTQTIHDIWCGEKYKQYRSKVLNDQDHIIICNRCPVALSDQEVTGPSRLLRFHD